VALIFEEHDRMLEEREARMNSSDSSANYYYGYHVEDEVEEATLHAMLEAARGNKVVLTPSVATVNADDYEDEEAAGIEAMKAKFLVDKKEDPPLVSTRVAPVQQSERSDSDVRPDPYTEHEGSETATPTETKPAKRKRNRNRKNRQPQPSTEPTDEPVHHGWPVKVCEKLDYFFSPEAASRMVNGRYQMTTEERRVFKHRDQRRQSKVVSLDQRDHATALRLFNTAYTDVITPNAVLADTGADVGICISEHIATKLRLTWTVGSAPLSGIGGIGKKESRADQNIVLRLGGNGSERDIDTLPEEGCFTLTLRPIVMSDETVQSVGHSCIIGQGVMWRGLASFDQYNETMDISPAYPCSGCAEFRVSFPCIMSRPKSSMVAFLAGSDEQGPMSDYLPPPPPSRKLLMATQDTTQAAKTDPTTTTFTTLKAATGEALHAVSHAIVGILPGIVKPKSRGSTSSRSSGRSTHKPNVMNRLPGSRTAAPLYPGFPQSDNPPTREEYKVKKEEATARNAAAKTEAQEARAQANRAVPFTPATQDYRRAVVDDPHMVKPIGITFDVEDLKRTGRLTADGVLNFGDSAEATVRKVLAQEEAKRRQMQVEFDHRLKKLEAEIASMKRNATPSRSAPMETLNQNVRAVDVPVDQALPKPQPTPSSTGATGSGTAQELYVPPHNRNPDPTPAEAYGSKDEDNWQEVKNKRQQRAGRQLPPAQPSSHPMATRRSGTAEAQPQGGQVTTARAAMTVNPRGAHLPVNADSWNRLKGKASAPSNRHRVAFRVPSTSLAMVAAFSLPAMTVAQATGPNTPYENMAVFEDAGFFAAQIAAALAVWVAFALGRFWAREKLWATRFLNAGATLATSLWFQQLLGARASVAAVWQQAILCGTATPALCAFLACCLWAAHAWFRAEQRLFRKARRL
jgi:hypothetical protein